MTDIILNTAFPLDILSRFDKFRKFSNLTQVLRSRSHDDKLCISVLISVQIGNWVRKLPDLKVVKLILIASGDTGRKLNIISDTGFLVTADELQDIRQPRQWATLS